MQNFLDSLECDKILNFLHTIGIQIANVVQIFQNFRVYISMVIVQILIDCSLFDRFCFRCIVCLFQCFHNLY